VPRDLDVPGRDLPGVVFAMDYLEAQNRVVAGDLAASPIHAGGKRVVILGGGDTGSDCLGTAHRQGAADVAQIELLPAPPEARAAANPWPQWPLIFRTSSSQEEGGERRFALRTTRLEGDGRLQRLHAVGVEVVTEGGRMRIVDVPGTEQVHEVDLLLLAMGFVSPATAAIVAQAGAARDPRGNLAVDRRFRTTVPGLYAAGDCKRGQSLVVWALAEGREAARAIDADLVGTRPRLPTRGADAPFGR